MMPLNLSQSLGAAMLKLFRQDGPNFLTPPIEKSKYGHSDWVTTDFKEQLPSFEM